MSHPVKERFDFFKIHYNDAKREFAPYQRKVSDSLCLREKSLLTAKVSDENQKILAEMTRDIRIFKSRLSSVSDKLDDVGRLTRVAQSAISTPSGGGKAADDAAEAFLAWRDLRRDFCDSLTTAIAKWQKFEQDMRM